MSRDAIVVVFGAWLSNHVHAQPVPAAPTAPFAGSQDPTALKERARALAKQGDYAKAVKAFEAAVAAAERAFGPNHQKTDIVVNELAIAHYQQGNYSVVEQLYLRVLHNTEARPGHDVGEVATCLNNLGALYDEMGDYGKAEENYTRSLSLRESSLQKNHPDLATNYSNLASVARNQGNTAKAIELYRQSIQLYGKQPRPDDTQIAIALNGLAESHVALGQYDLAEPLYLRSLKLREAKLGTNHPSLAITLNNLAGLYKRQKRFVEAEELYQRSLSIRQEKLGADHPGVATAFSNLASLYRDQGRYDEAIVLNEKALSIREAKLGNDHPSVAISLNNLGGLAMDLDQGSKADRLYQRSLKILNAKNGPDHPEVAMAYNNIAYLHAKLGDWSTAANDFDQSRRIVRKHVSQILPALSEADQLTFLKVTDENYLHAALSLALLRHDDPAIAEVSAGWVLNAKGIAQQSVAQRMMLNLDLNDPAIGPSVKKLQEVRRELSRLTGSAPKGDEAVRMQRVQVLREQEQQIGTEVARASGRPVQNSQWVELDTVRSALKPKTVLIEIARFRRRDFYAKHADPNKWQSPHYAAWIIPAANEGPVRMIDLGSAESMETAIRSMRQALARSADSIRSNGEAEAEQKLAGPLSEVAKIAFGPVVSQIGEATTLIVSPDASMWLIPWAALPLNDKRYAIEEYNLTYVISGRDVIRHDLTPRLNAPMVLADPDYDLAPTEVIAATRAMLRNLTQRRVVSKVRPAVDLPPVSRLPATALEAQAILPKLESYCGKTPRQHLANEALEGVVKSIRQPQVLVLSTHGFFREDEETATDESGDASSRRGAAPENPLLRCGLLLAGCNSRQLSAVADTDDGVLTGLEVAGIDLRGTELVVLSACETGLGEVRNGEGVAGLRQAFQLAGARSVIATLWEVPDVQTARLISDFFTHLSTSENQAAALRKAQLATIERRRDRANAAHPFFWAALTLTGTP